MTINIGLLTNELVVFSCDSVASISRHYVDPFRCKWEETEGEIRIAFRHSDITPLVTEAWGGVTKMFSLHEGATPVAAVTSGLAKLNDRTMSSLAEDFRAKAARRKQQRVQVEVVARDFLRFLRTELSQHYEGTDVPEQFWQGPEFLVGGYGRDDRHPSLYRVRVKENQLDTVFEPGVAGVAWGGQSSAVERFVFGTDSEVRTRVEVKVRRALDRQHKRFSEAMAENLQAVVEQLGGELPEGYEASLPQQQDVNLPWEKGNLSIDFPNLPQQAAIDLASFLVYLQCGRSKFAQGVPTVGGRIHVGMITKSGGFKMLNEPDLRHLTTGFAGDF